MRGADKLLEAVGTRPILRCIAERALSVTPHVGVTLRPDDLPRQRALAGLGVTDLYVTDAAEGMAASLRAGARWAMTLECDALMVALPDMPEITAQDMRSLIAAQAQAPQQPLRASAPQGTPGHPVIFPRALFAAMLGLTGDEGAKTLLRAHPPRLHVLDGQRAVLDLDTPEDWQAWRKGHPPA